MNFCTHCGTKRMLDAFYCIECGSKFNLDHVNAVKTTLITLSDSGFISFAKSLSLTELKNLVNDYYTSLSNTFSYKASFGPDGAKEFVVYLLLYTYDQGLNEEIEYALEQVFTKKWGPLDCSDYIEKVVREKSVINYSTFSEVYRYIEQNHRWIEFHECANKDEFILSASTSAILYSLFKGRK